MKPFQSVFLLADTWRCRALLAAAIAFSSTVAAAKTVQLSCPRTNGSGAALATVDYAAQTLGVDDIDAMGNVTIMAYHRMPAQITDETVSAIWKHSGGYVRFTLNRYSGVMRQESDMGAGYSSAYSNPCTKYQRGPKKF